MCCLSGAFLFSAIPFEAFLAMPDAEEIVMSEKETKSEKEENKDKEDKLEDDEFLQHILFHKNLTLTKSTLVHFDHTFGKTHPLDVPYPPPELG